MTHRLRDRLRLVARLLVVLATMMVCCDLRADERLPLQLQAQLIARLGTFDRNFRTRAGPAAQILVLRKAGNSDSGFAAAGLAKALADLNQVGGVPAKVDEAEFEGGPALAARCRAQKIAVVYFSVGLEQEMGRAADALAGVDVLTIGASAEYAEKGAVVGFGLEEARPKIVLNLRRARAQNVDFKAELLKLARIVE